MIGLGALGLPFHLRRASVSIAWNPNSEGDLAGYRVSGVPLVTVLITRELNDVGNNTSGVALSLASSTTYYIAVFAYNASGQESPASDEISYSTPGSHADSYSHTTHPDTYSDAPYPDSYSHASYPNSYSHASYPNSYSHASYPDTYSHASYPNTYSHASYPDTYSHASTPLHASYPDSYSDSWNLRQSNQHKRQCRNH